MLRTGACHIASCLLSYFPVTGLLSGTKHLWQTLSHVSSFWYALGYLLLIPVFAVIYACLPHKSFYHSTIQFEEALKRTEVDLMRSLSELFTISVSKNLGEERTLGQWRLGNLRCSELDIVTEEVRFLLSVPLMHGTKKWTLFGRFVITLNLTPHVMIGDDDLKNVQLDDSRFLAIVDNVKRMVPDLAEVDLASLISALFSSHPSILPRPDSLTLVMPKTLSRAFERLADARNGFPTGVAGNFARMLYLSAVTITTSFGDILPITNVSRALVTVQSILGLVLIGLFLNAIAQAGK